MSDDKPTRRDRERAAAGETRVYAEGDLQDVDHHDVTRLAGLIPDDDLRHVLDFAANAYRRHRDPLEDPELNNLSWWQDRVERGAGDMLTDAVAAGNISQMEFITGMPEYESDVSGLHALQDLERWLLDSEACKVTYLADRMGRGKTEFTHLCFDLIRFRSVRRDDLEAPEFRCNIPTSDVPSICEWSEFKAWVKRGSIGDNRWFVFDEGSQALTGYSADREAVETLMSRLVKLARKYGVNMIIIGHTGMDLHADLRRLADYVTKPSLKSARIYSTVNSGEGQGLIQHVRGLPPARDHGFKTDDTAPWSWGDALEDDDPAFDEETLKRMMAVRAARLAERSDDLTQADAADLLSGGPDDVTVSTYMVSKAKQGAYADKIPSVAGD